MRNPSSLRPRASARRLFGGATALALVGTAALISTPVASADALLAPPAYREVSAGVLGGQLRSDIAGSAFVDADGQFHWTTALTAYDPSPQNAWARTFTNTNLGTVASGLGSSTVKFTADALYNSPNGVCYNLDEHPEFPIASPLRDDHCDVLGVWIDPATGTWHALLNDEFQFDPWQTAGATATVDQKIKTGHHNNRILLATSDDKGASWQYQGPALTSGWDAADGIITPETSPGTTYPFGNSGCRLFVDYSSGYFYLTYNVKIYKKPASSTVATWTAMARAPISGGMASGTWTKYRDGAWTEPGIGGIDGNVGDVAGLTVDYDATTDTVSYSGLVDGQHLDFRTTTVQSDRILAFKDADGTAYQANTLTHKITRMSDAVVVPQVDYTDPKTGMAMNIVGKDDVYENGVKVFTGGVFVTQTDPATGSARTLKVNTGTTVFEDPQTQRLYVPFGNNESAISYNAYSGTYRIVGYDGNVYDTPDLSDPTGWQAAGTNPAGSFGGYLTTLDDGSLTNQNVTGSSYLTVSDLSGAVKRVAMTAPNGQSVFTRKFVPRTKDGAEIDLEHPYVVGIGGTGLGFTDHGQAPRWLLVPVENPDYADGSGFYRLQNVRDESFLQVEGGTVEETRAIGATVTTGPRQPEADPAANGGIGAPGGSDQWYVQVVSPSTTGASASTSLEGSTTYRLVNRNSGLALQLADDGTFVLAQQAPGETSQYLTFANTPNG